MRASGEEWARGEREGGRTVTEVSSTVSWRSPATIVSTSIRCSASSTATAIGWVTYASPLCAAAPRARARRSRAPRRPPAAPPPAGSASRRRAPRRSPPAAGTWATRRQSPVGIAPRSSRRGRGGGRRRRAAPRRVVEKEVARLVGGEDGGDHRDRQRVGGRLAGSAAEALVELLRLLVGLGVGGVEAELAALDRRARDREPAEHRVRHPVGRRALVQPAVGDDRQRDCHGLPTAVPAGMGHRAREDAVGAAPLLLARAHLVGAEARRVEERGGDVPRAAQHLLHARAVDHVRHRRPRPVVLGVAERPRPPGDVAGRPFPGTGRPEHRAPLGRAVAQDAVGVNPRLVTDAPPDEELTGLPPLPVGQLGFLLVQLRSARVQLEDLPVRRRAQRELLQRERPRRQVLERDVVLDDQCRLHAVGPRRRDRTEVGERARELAVVELLLPVVHIHLVRERRGVHDDRGLLDLQSPASMHAFASSAVHAVTRVSFS